ncbi:MAG TPA: FAD binding domain-containing protein [Xanthobacteraceae bacterium]
MKPARFDYARAASLDEATKLLSEAGGTGKALAGSQSLGPMLNLRIAQPELLVDVTSIPELTTVAEHRDHVDIGACITHADIEDGRIADPSLGLLSYVAGGIAYRAVRNRGTVGGSLAHADPAADWVSVIPLLGAELLTQSPRGNRSIAADRLMVSSFVTTLAADELICAIRVPKVSARSRWGFCKFNQKVGEFAHCIGGILYDPDNRRYRAVIGAIETAPIVIVDATELFSGPFGPDLDKRLDIKALLALLDDKEITDDYTRQLAPVALKRAARQASAS